MKKFFGFTLSELMVAVAVLGVLSAIVLPMLFRANPNQNKMMMKKAYYTTSNIVSEMINDVRMFPAAANSPTLKGFDDVSTVSIGGVSYGGATKFGQLFQSFLNVDEDLYVSATTAPLPCVQNQGLPVSALFRTQDGMMWCIQLYHNGAAEPLREAMGYKISVDTNGTRNPNCYQGYSECSDRTRNFDIFSMNVEFNGRIQIPTDQTWARDAVTVSSDMSDD